MATRMKPHAITAGSAEDSAAAIFYWTGRRTSRITTRAYHVLVYTKGDPHMATTFTPGITVDAVGRRTINKEYRGVRLFRRLGRISQEIAQLVLRNEVARLRDDFDRRAHARPLFRHCAARYLGESKDKRSADVISWHVRLLRTYFSELEPERIHDATLRPFVDARLRDGASATTVNRSLEVMRTILNRAARAYRDDDGRPWLGRLPR